MRRLLQTRRHTLHHTAHDHEGNRREGKQLGNPDPQSTIKPACRRQVKGIFQQLIHDAGAAKQQNQSEPDHKRRRDDGQQGDHAQWRLDSRAGTALGQQRHHGSQQRRTGGRQQGQKKRVPGHAATHTTGQTVQTPDALIANAIKDGSQRPLPLLCQQGAVQGLADRERNEQQQQHRAANDGGCNEKITLEITAPRQPEGGDHQQREQGQEGTAANTELPQRQFSPQCSERIERPALGANQKTTHQQPHEPGQSASQQPATLHLAGRDAQPKGGDRQAQQPQPQPEPPVQQGLQQAIGRFRAAQNLRQDAVPRGILDRIPGQQQVSQQAQRQPDANSLVGVLLHQRGRELTSFSHFAIRRRRSALAPYLA